MKNYLIILFVLVFLVISGCSTTGFKEFEGKDLINRNKKDLRNVTFRLKDTGQRSVYLAGDFNDWNTSANPMEKKDGYWSISLNLTPGKYQYKFYINDSKWKEDPKNPDTTDDGYGGVNSIIIVGEENMEKKTEREIKNHIKVLPVKFTYQPLTGGKHNVYIAGDFNNWNTTATPLKEKDGIYEIILDLEPGKYAYKFVVDGAWVTDENAEEFSGDGYGGQNSVVIVGDKKKLNALYKVEFQYRPEDEVKNVHLAGSFNGWNQKANKMEKNDEGVYKTKLLLKKGRYAYKFIVDGNKWITDMSAPLFEDDGFGGKNSVIEVNDQFTEVVVKKEDGIITTYGIPTSQSIETVNPISENKIEFKTKVHSNDVENVYLCKNGERIEMNYIDKDDIYDYYNIFVELKPPTEEFDYYFIYKDGDQEYYLLDGEITKTLNKEKVFHYSKDIVKPFFTPDWAKNGVIYQIFCDRFYNGKKENDQDFREWYYEGVKNPPPPGKKLPPNKQYFHLVKDWYDISGLKSNPYRHDGKPDWWSFYGGDIEGVRKKLPYLKDLGITIIYFNPLFEAKSNHKYDAVDYMKLDPHFGTEREFKKFVKEAHENGIKIIIDCAFNHTGDTFWAFQDCKKKGKNSEYWDWYEWKRWPLPDPIPKNFNPSDYYECWWNVGEMPDLNYDLSKPNPAENSVKDIKNADPNWNVVNYIIGVAEYWIKDMDVDGFRLDVPNEVPFWFWEFFHKKVKSFKPNAYLVGEIWGNATEWVNNKYFDAVMNYAFFKDPVMRFFAMRSCNAKKFDRDIKKGLLVYPIQAVQAMMNLIDSHDTFRYLETVNGDIAKLKLTALFQMTFVGVPHIWYGDEIGMMGTHDPDCRRPFNWKYKENNDLVNLRNYYKKLISLRNNNSCLRTGSFQTLLADRMTYSYLRKDVNCEIVVIINNDTKKSSVEINTGLKKLTMKDLLKGKEYELNKGKLNIEIPPMKGIILK